MFNSKPKVMVYKIKEEAAIGTVKTVELQLDTRECIIIALQLKELLENKPNNSFEALSTLGEFLFHQAIGDGEVFFKPFQEKLP